MTMNGIIGKKIGMTSIFDEEGVNIPCTVIQAGPCFVTQIRTLKNDGYSAVQLGYEDRKDKNLPKALKGHFKKSGVAPKKRLVEFRNPGEEVKLGQEVKCDIFAKGELVDVTGYTKGRGFQGVVKRHGFAGVGEMTHGQSDRQRSAGSIGGASDPSRVFKGMKMAGRTGNEQRKIEDLTVIKVLPEKDILFLKGGVPGHKGSYLIIEK